MDTAVVPLSLDDDRQLRGCLRDLVALSALPALWIKYEAPQIAESVAGALARMLSLEFVHVSLPKADIAATDARPPSTSLQRRAIAEALTPFLRRETAFQSVRIDNPLGVGAVQVVLFPVGFGLLGHIALGSRDSGFPSEAQRLLVNVASNQLAIVLQRLEAHQALQRSEERLQQLTSTLEERVAERTRQLEAEIVERERAESALRQAQKMEALGQLTGGVAHDINNLLMVIGGNLELLKRRTPEAMDERQFRSISRAVGQGQNLTRQLLAFSRQQPLSPKVVDPAQDLPKIIDDLVRHSLRGDIEVETHIAPDAWPIMADATELEMAMLNIAINARDSELAGDAVRIALADTGTGIAPEILPRVFEPFFTSKEIGRGTGLGLSQVYGFAKQSGGLVRIASTPGAGTTVSLFLPRWQGAAPAAGTVAAPRASRRGTGRVLMVEDNDEVAEITQLLLSDDGYEVVRARTAREALGLLDVGTSCDLILSDIIMPGGMNGLELARAVRRGFPALPVLLMSGYSRSAQEAMDEGFALLAKPFQREALQEQIDRVLAGRA
ncbi:MAG TPA: response regulator [Stellaceae bacterium]|nr:response regulator [Stellaceae bacterium]